MIAGEGNRFESSFLGDSFNLFISALWLVRFYSPPLGTVTYLVHHNFKVGLNSLFFCKVYIFFQLTRFTVRRFTVRRFRVQLYSCIPSTHALLKSELETFRALLMRAERELSDTSMIHPFTKPPIFLCSNT